MRVDNTTEGIVVYGNDVTQARKKEIFDEWRVEMKQLSAPQLPRTCVIAPDVEGSIHVDPHHVEETAMLVSEPDDPDGMLFLIRSAFKMRPHAIVVDNAHRYPDVTSLFVTATQTGHHGSLLFLDASNAEEAQTLVKEAVRDDIEKVSSEQVTPGRVDEWVANLTYVSA